MATLSRRVGLIGLGSMGSNIAERLHGSGYSLVLYNRTDERYATFRNREGIQLSNGIGDLVSRLRGPEGPAIVWVMVPGGAVTNALIAELSTQLRRDDIVIDASNSIYQDSVENYNRLRAMGISYLDVGCAGGPDDLKTGVALMVGGDRPAYDKAEGIFKVVAGSGAYGYLGGSGSGHLAKLAHNGIFYGIFPVYAEGVELLMNMKDRSPERNFDINEALRLLGSAPPINAGIMKAISDAVKGGKIPDSSPPIGISDMVKWEMENGENAGVKFSVTRSILGAYSSMSDRSRRIYAGAKWILTGH